MALEEIPPDWERGFLRMPNDSERQLTYAALENESVRTLAREVSMQKKENGKISFDYGGDMCGVEINRDNQFRPWMKVAQNGTSVNYCFWLPL